MCNYMGFTADHMYFAILLYCAGLSKIECVPFLQTFAWPCQNDLPHFTCRTFCAVRMLPWPSFFVLPFLCILLLSPSFQDPLTQRWTELTWVLPFENQLLQEDVAAQELLWQSFEQNFPDGNIGVADMKLHTVAPKTGCCFSLKWFDFKGS